MKNVKKEIILIKSVLKRFLTLAFDEFYDDELVEDLIKELEAEQEWTLIN